jgi:hypothetical protein
MIIITNNQKKLQSMLEKLFKKEKLNVKNILILAIYTVFSFFLYIYFDVTKKPNIYITMYYTFLTHFWLISFDYRALRKLNYYSIWFVIGIIHFIIYLKIKDNSAYAFVKGHAADGFRTTLILLLFFQFVRFLSFEVQGMDYVFPPKSGKMDMYNEREYTKWDILFTFVLFGVMLISNIIF